MKINGRLIGPTHEPYIVAELSGEHRGSLKRGCEMIDAATDAGADAVKLQCYTADTLTFRGDGDEFKIMEGPWAGRTLYDLYSEAQTPREMVAKLIAYGQERGITIFSSVFSLEDVEFVYSLGVPAIKIASFELTDIPLIHEAAKTGLPVIISTGMGSGSEIKEAMGAYKLYGKLENLGLLHCTSSYPTLPSEANLPALGPLSDLVGGAHVVGLSDHSLGVGVSAGAVAFGACIVEKHFCLERSHAGPDAGFSLEPDEFGLLVRTCKEVWQATRMSLPVRRPAYVPFRKSLYVVQDVACGQAFCRENVRSIRPAAGLPPKLYQSVLAGVATQALKAGTPLQRTMVSSLC